MQDREKKAEADNTKEPLSYGKIENQPEFREYFRVEDNSQELP